MFAVMNSLLSTEAPASALTADPLSSSGRDLSSLKSFGQRQSAAEFAYEQLREAVISLHLEPGAVIARGAIAQRLGVSQTPVREALVRLQEERLIEVIPQSATRVSKIDLASAREAHFLRLSVELEIVRRLSQRPSPNLSGALQTQLAQMQAALAAGDHTAFTAADEAFHSALYQAAEVPDLQVLVRRRSGHLDRLRRLHLPAPGKADAVLIEHKDLTDAITAGDMARSEQCLRAHMSGTFAEIEQLRRTTPHYFHH
jgi:DNA-binding GntR family transcriptional regulator